MNAQAGHDNQAIDEEPAASRLDGALDLLEATAPHIALLASWIATCGSLFFSEVLGWLPCLLCWYQQILMYPLALVLAVGILRRDRGLHLYVLPFSILGACVSLYHYLLVKTDWLPPPPCASGIPCTVDYLNWFGFINIPFLALTAFLIITLMLVTWVQVRRPEEAEPVEEAATRAHAPAGGRLDGARLAVPIIIVGVVLSFLLASAAV